MLEVKRILATQLILGLSLAVLTLPLGVPVAISVLIGAATCLLANATLAAWVFRQYRAQRPERLLARFYSAEIAKIALTLGAFAIAFVAFDELNITALLAAYFLVQVMSTLIAAGSQRR